MIPKLTTTMAPPVIPFLPLLLLRLPCSLQFWLCNKTLKLCRVVRLPRSFRRASAKNPTPAVFTSFLRLVGWKKGYSLFSYLGGIKSLRQCDNEKGIIKRKIIYTFFNKYIPRSSKARFSTKYKNSPSLQ